ncbi:MAG TPA: DUF1365 domain-containing protein [Kofleriaceae bacterium]|jgi:DUF1365 family protein
MRAIDVERGRHSALYSGTLVHSRRDSHIRRAFRYPVYMAAIDLAELPALHRELRLFSHNARNVMSLHDRDYEGGADLLASLAALRAKHALPTPASTTLVTNLRVANYTFNPVSFFLDYDANGFLTSVIAEVNNTYGGRHRYVLGPPQRLPDEHDRIGFRTERVFFVSPFLHGDRTYDWWFPARRDPAQLAITMHVATPSNERIFTAAMTGTRKLLTDRAIAAATLRYPLMTAQVIGLIHLEALILRYRHEVPYRTPGSDHRPLDE